MKKIKLVVIVFILALSFTACNTSDSLESVVDNTEIENQESTDEEEDEESSNGSGGMGG